MLHNNYFVRIHLLLDMSIVAHDVDSGSKLDFDALSEVELIYLYILMFQWFRRSLRVCQCFGTW